MRFGLANTPKTFMKLMNNVFWEYLDKCLIVFIDDILVYSRTKGEREWHLCVAMNKLCEHQLFAKLRSVVLENKYRIIGSCGYGRGSSCGSRKKPHQLLIGLCLRVPQRCIVFSGWLATIKSL